MNPRRRRHQRIRRKRRANVQWIKFGADSFEEFWELMTRQSLLISWIQEQSW